MTLLVIIGHCAYYSMVTRHGGVDYVEIMNFAGVADTYVHNIYSLIADGIYTFHMPMFMALSGAVFYAQRQAGKYQDSWKFILGKSRRLLVPFFLATAFFDVPIKYISSYWDNSTNIIYDMLVSQIFLQGSNHLWFLVICFIDLIIFQQLTRLHLWHSHHLVLITTLGILWLFLKRTPLMHFFVFSQSLQYLIWFYFGILFEKNRQRFNNGINKKRLLVSALGWLICWWLMCERFLPNTEIMKCVITLLGMIAFYISCYYLTISGQYKHIIAYLANLSLGIYLFSDPLNYYLLMIFVAIFSINGFGNEFLATLLYISRFAIQLLAGIGVTLMVRKFNLMKV